MTAADTNGERAPQPRDGNQRYRRVLDTVTRDAQAARDHARGATYEELAIRFGYSSRGDAWRGVQKVLVETARREGADILRQMLQAQLTEVFRESWADVLNPQPLVDRMGRPVLDANGQPQPDRIQKAASLKNVLAALAQLRALRGLDAPKSSLRTSISMGLADIDAIMRAAQDELAKMDRERQADQRAANVIEATVDPPDENDEPPAAIR